MHSVIHAHEVTVVYDFFCQMRARAIMNSVVYDHFRASGLTRLHSADPKLLPKQAVLSIARSSKFQHLHVAPTMPSEED